MKRIYLLVTLLALLSWVNVNAEIELPHANSFMNGDTITLRFGGGSAQLEDEICVPLYAENFTEVIAFQWQIEYDPNIFSFNDLITHPEFENFNLSGLDYNSNLPGKIIVTFTEAISSLSIESEPIFEICLQVNSVPDIPTHLSISNPEDFLMEIVRSGPSVAPVIVQSENIFIENLLDCGLLLICPMNNEYVFSPNMVIHKREFIEQYDIILRCHDYADEQIKLINMSAPGSLPSDSLIMTCDNVYQNTTIGVVISGTSMSVTDGISTMDTTSFLLCQSHVIINIPDNIENCINTMRSCIDPLRCKTLQIDVSEPTIVIDYNTLLDTNGFDFCQTFYFSNYESIAAIPDEYPDGFLLTCIDYQSELPVHVTVEAQLSDNQFFVGEICTSLIEINGINSACENDTIYNTEIPVEVKQEVNIITINGAPMLQKGPSLYAFTPSELQETNNVISINKGVNNGLFGISTLDMVMQYKILINDENYTAPVAIAADIDLSGSLTTKDIGILRFNILGISEGEFLDKNFILEKNQILQGLDYLNFINDYEDYSFDKIEVIGSNGLSFEIFKYGDLSSTLSEFHKTSEIELSQDVEVQDQFIEKGQNVRIPISINSNLIDPIVALNLAFTIEGLGLKSIDHSFSGNALIHHNENKTLKISYAEMKNEKSFEIELAFEANKSGMLSDMIQLDYSSVNEIVTHGLVATKPVLSFTEIAEGEDYYIYPNPVNQTLFINSTRSKIGSTVKLYNAIGQLLTSETIKNERHQIDLQKLNAKGLIHVVIFDKNDNSSFIIVAQ